MRSSISALVLALALTVPSTAVDAETSAQGSFEQCSGGRHLQQLGSYEELISVLTCVSQRFYRCDELPAEHYGEICLKAKEYSMTLGQTYLAMMHNAKSRAEKDALLSMYTKADENGRDRFLATVQRLNDLHRRFVNQEGEFSPERLRALTPPPVPPQVVVVPPAPVPRPSLSCTSNRIGNFMYTDCQ